MKQVTVHSPEAAIVKMRERLSARLATFPAKIWAEGHTPGKEPLVATDETVLRSAVMQAIGVSRSEFGKNGAVLEWSSR